MKAIYHPPRMPTKPDWSIAMTLLNNSLTTEYPVCAQCGRQMPHLVRLGQIYCDHKCNSAARSARKKAARHAAKLL
jgi:tRNA(Ile2) C34 agmatinyltransferase TiaS